MLYPMHYYDNAEMTGEPIMHSFIKIQSGWLLFGCDNNRGSGLTSKPYKFKQLYDAYVDGGSKGKVVVPCCVLDLDEVDIEAEGTYYDEILGDETRFAYSEIDAYTLEGEAEPTDPTDAPDVEPTDAPEDEDPTAAPAEASAADDGAEEPKGNAGLIICIVAAFLIAGVVAFIVIKKKKYPSSFQNKT